MEQTDPSAPIDLDPAIADLIARRKYIPPSYREWDVQPAPTVDQRLRAVRLSRAKRVLEVLAACALIVAASILMTWSADRIVHPAHIARYVGAGQ